MDGKFCFKLNYEILIFDKQKNQKIIVARPKLAVNEPLEHLKQNFISLKVTEKGLRERRVKDFVTI